MSWFVVGFLAVAALLLIVSAWWDGEFSSYEMGKRPSVLRDRPAPYDWTKEQ